MARVPERPTVHRHQRRVPTPARHAGDGGTRPAAHPEGGGKKPPVQGIAGLRFHAGVVGGPKGPGGGEQGAGGDLPAGSGGSGEGQRQGGELAQWTWDDGKLIVASADGVTDEYQLRQGKPKEPPPQTQPNRTAEQRVRRPRTLFELLFGF